MTRTVVQWLLLIVVIGLLIGLVLWIRSVWNDDDDAAIQDHLMLSEMSELKRRGELSDEEYRSIKGRLTSRLGDSSQSVRTGEGDQEIDSPSAS